MTQDLFSSDTTFEQLPMPGAEVWLLRRFDGPLPADELLQELMTDTPWKAEEIVVWGKRYLQPRLTAWYGDPGCGYTYSGIAMNPLPWTPRLAQLRQRVEAVCGETFNSVLLNLYRHERDSMGMHSDDEPELGPRPVIASLSLGELRTLVFKHKRLRELPSVSVPLACGNLLLMKGDTQANWKHGISKSSKPLGPRLNLTFRRIDV